jgi:hypothetical protein
LNHLITVADIKIGWLFFVAVVLTSRYQRPLQKIETIHTSLLRLIKSHETAHMDRVFVITRGASVGSFLSLPYVSLTTHADPYKATLSPVGRGEVTSHSSRAVVVGWRPAWSPSRGNEGDGRGRLHGGHG